MPWTGKQRKFFQAVAHGMKPREGDLSQGKAKELLGHENEQGKALTRPRKKQRD